jgi:hypothetical protein
MAAAGFLMGVYHRTGTEPYRVYSSLIVELSDDLVATT